MTRLAIESAQVTLLDSARGRSLIELHGSDSSAGVAETCASSDSFASAKRLCESFIGADALKTGELQERLKSSAPDCPPGVAGGFENAVWDLIGHHLKAPLYQLFGASRPAPVLAPGVIRVAGEAPEALVACAKALVRDSGHEALLVVASGRGAKRDALAMRALREAFGSAMRLRLECFGAYGAEDAASLLKEVEDLDLEYVADPVPTRVELERLHRDSRTPLASSSQPVQGLAFLVRTDAAEVIVGNSTDWGGIAPFRKNAAVCRAFALDMAVSGWEILGPSLAVALHLVPTHAAASKGLHGVAFDAGQSVLAGALPVRGGRIAVPEAPGIGVGIDRVRVQARKVEEAVISGASR